MGQDGRRLLTWVTDLRLVAQSGCNWSRDLTTATKQETPSPSKKSYTSFSASLFLMSVSCRISGTVGLRRPLDGGVHEKLPRSDWLT